MCFNQSTFFSVLLDRIILKKPLSIFKVIITVALMTGVVLVALPNLTIVKLVKSDRISYFIGAFFGLASAATYSLKLLLVFMVKYDVNPSVCLWYASFGHLFCSICIAIVDGKSSIIRGKSKSHITIRLSDKESFQRFFYSFELNLRFSQKNNSLRYILKKLCSRIWYLNMF